MEITRRKVSVDRHETGMRTIPPDTYLDGGVRDALAAASGGDVSQHAARVRVAVHRHMRRQQRDGGLQRPHVQVKHRLHARHLHNTGQTAAELVRHEMDCKK